MSRKRKYFKNDMFKVIKETGIKHQRRLVMKESEFNKERDLSIEAVGCNDFLVDYTLTFTGQAIIKVPKSEMINDDFIPREYIEVAMNHREIATMLYDDDIDSTDGIQIMDIEEFNND